jgi:regulator of cell morphogenesis and NO signaling
MKIQKTPETQVTFNHSIFELNEAFLKLQEEHTILQEELTELYAMAKTIGLNGDAVNWVGALRDLKKKTSAFQSDLEAHADWETKVMFPMASWYLGEELDQFTLMEQEHVIAVQFIEAFLEAVERITQPVPTNEAKDMASYLLQAYEELQNHFRREEEIIESLTDRSNAYGY